MPTKTKLHPAERYARDVVNGKIIACKWVRLACERHLFDLKTAKKRGIYFDQEAAGRVLEFFSLLKHSKGKWAGSFFVLEPWEQFILWVLFGWKRKDGTRRFRIALIEIARKNGKSTLAAGIGIYLAFADGEAGARVYSAATKRDQARIVHGEAIQMVKKNPALRKYIKVFRDNLHMVETDSLYEPLGADTQSDEGLNLHGGIIDELHAHKTRDMWDILETSISSRTQPLIVAITTAGTDRRSICYEKHDYTCRVLEGFQDGSFVDDEWFGIIYSLDEEDKEHWQDERLWIKANPNLGVSKTAEGMRKMIKRAAQMPASQNSILRRELNMWVHGENKWMDMDAWRRCAGEVSAIKLPGNLKGEICYGGLDLSSTRDLTAQILVFPKTEGGERVFDVIARFWLPEEAILPRTQEGTHYEAWVREGWIEATTGNVLDYEFVYAQIEQDYNDFNVRRMAYDRWGAPNVAQILENMGLTVVPFGQGFGSISAPMKELERLILGGKIRHGNNPVLTWMMDNVVARLDPAGNIKPDKEKSKEKIDGVVALIMALDQATRGESSGETNEVPEDWGV